MFNVSTSITFFIKIHCVCLSVCLLLRGPESVSLLQLIYRFSAHKWTVTKQTSCVFMCCMCGRLEYSVFSCTNLAEEFL